MRNQQELRNYNLVGLQYGSDMEIIEFHSTIEFEAQEGDLEETPDLVELNSLDFFIKALLYFGEEAQGQLSSSEPSPVSLVRSETQRFDIWQDIWVRTRRSKRSNHGFFGSI